MRRIIFILLAMAAIHAAQGQTHDFRLGFEASPFISWLRSDLKTIPSDGSNVGFQVIVNGEYYFRENYAFKIGLGLSFRNGGKLLFPEGGVVFPRAVLSRESLRELPPNSSVRHRLQFVEIPFGFRMRTQQIGYMRYFAELPIISLGVRVQARGDLGVADGNDENIAKDARLFNLSWGAGAGAEYDISSSTSLIAGIFYHHGFLDIMRDNNANPANIQLRRLAFRIGVMF
jgi:hypothetical protein